MALVVRGKTECSLCSSVINDSDDIVATPQFISDEHDPFWRFSDAAMHRSCFMAWEQRLAFVTKFNRTVEGFTFGNGTYHQMQAEGVIVVFKRNA